MQCSSCSLVTLNNNTNNLNFYIGDVGKVKIVQQNIEVPAATQASTKVHHTHRIKKRTTAINVKHRKTGALQKTVVFIFL